MNATRELTEPVTALEAKVRQALVSGDVTGIEVLGYGEISVVVKMTTDSGSFAAKRLPRFTDRASFDRYSGLLADYLEALREAGVNPISSDLVAVDNEITGGGITAYCVQPALGPASLGPGLLRRSDAPDLLSRVIGITVDAIGPRLGLDAQISNWALVDGDLIYLDVTTPMLRDDTGAELLDSELFLASLPWLLRGGVRRFLLDEILGHYYDPRAAVLDLAGNLIKEKLGKDLPAALDAANQRVDPPITEDQARAYYRSDARTWALLQRLRHLDRAWQRRVRRRVYPFLIPGRIER